MKKLLLVIAGVLMFAGVSYAQDYKPFKIGLGLGYAMPTGEGAGAGALGYIEPMYRIMDEIAVGLRLEGAAVAKASIEPDGSFGTVSGAAIASYTLSGQYYFSNNTFRPLAGLGFGLYSVTAGAASSNSETASGGYGNENKFGFYPRIGFDAGHFNLLLEYNFIPASDVPAYDTNGQATTVNVKNNYLGIKLGGSILGGRRRK